MSDAVTDTHALIWYLEDSPRLSAAANQTFEQCDRGEIVIYSKFRSNPPQVW